MSYFITRNECPVCGNTSFTELMNFPFTHPFIVNYFKRIYTKYNYPDKNIDYNYLEGANFCIAECISCGLIFQKEVANDKVMFKIYEEWTDIQHNFEINLNTHTPEYVINHTKEIFHILSLYNKKRADQYKVLDFGSGWSQWSRMAIAFGLDVYGLELSVTKKQFAEKFGIKMLSWEQLPEYQFDFINTEQVFEHLTNPLETLKYIKKCIHSESIIKISVPNSEGLKNYLLNKLNWDQVSDTDIFNSIAPLQHINAFTRGNLVSMAERTGFYIIPSQRFPYLEIVREDVNFKKLFSLNKVFIKSVLKKIIINQKKIKETGTYILIKKK